MTAPKETPNRIPLGLREPWKWVQPIGVAEIKQRLLEARDFNVHERERENMCSVAHGEIERLERDLEHDARVITELNRKLTAALARVKELEQPGYQWVPMEPMKPHVDGRWCTDLHCSKCYAADTWQNHAIACAQQNAANTVDAKRYAILFRNTWLNGKGVAVFSYTKDLDEGVSPDRLSIQQANEHLDALVEKAEGTSK